MNLGNRINLTFGTDAASAAKAAKNMSEALEYGLKGALGEAGKNFRALIQKAHDTGSKQASARMSKIINDSAGRLAQVEKSAKDAEAASHKAMKDEEKAEEEAKGSRATGEQKARAQETAAISHRLKAEAKQKRETFNNLAKIEQFNFGRIAAKEIKVAEEHAAILEAANKSAGKLMRTTFQEGGELVASGISAGMKTSLEDLQSAVTKSFAIAATSIPQMAVRASEARAARGEGPSAGLEMITKMGPVLLGVGAALAGVVLLFTAAYGQTKEFNKAILGGATAIDIMGSKALESGNGLKRSLGDIRDAAIQVAKSTNQSTDDVIKMVTSFNQAGVTLFELKGMFSKTGDATEAYTKSALFATTYTQVLGVSVDELTKTTDDLSRNMGLGLDSIKEGFSGIAGAATASGMNVKDFFTAVSQTTSGLALYNIRLSDTATSLVGLTKILGEKKAQEMLGAEGELGGQGFQEKYKTGMLVGKRGKAIFQNDFDSQSATFLEDFEKSPVGQSDGTKNTLNSVMTDGKIDAAKLAKLSGDDMGALQNKLHDAGNPGLARRLDKVQKVAIGSQGGARNMATGFSGLSGMSDQAMRIEKGMGLLGKKKMSELGAVERMAFEEQSGISGEKFDDVLQVMNSVSARIKDEKIKDINEKGGDPDEIKKKIANVKVTRAEAIAGLQSDKYTSKEDKKKIEDATKPMVSLETVARKQLDETTDINATLKNIIAVTLNTISGVLTNLLQFMPKWLDFGFADDTASTEDLDASNTASSGLAKDISLLESAIAKKEKEIEGASPGDKVKLEEELLGLKGRAIGKNSQLDVEKKVYSHLLEKGGTRDEARTKVLGISTTKEETVKGGQSGFYSSPDKIITRDKTQDEIRDDTNAANQALLDQGEDAAKSGVQMQTATDKVVEGVDETTDLLKVLDESAKKAAAVTLLSGISDSATVAAAQTGDPIALQTLEKLTRGNPQARAAATNAGLRFGGSVEDFIYRGDGTRGTINPISSKDQFFGAKPGGPIDQAINGQGGRGGVVNIYVNGGDEARVYNVVKRVIQESGLRPPAGGR